MEKQEGTHVCPVEGCEKTFQKPSRLLHHVRMHTGERPYVCEEPGCGKQYTRPAHLRRHKVSAHIPKDDRQKDIRCEFDGCAQMFMSRDSMKKHMHRFHTHKSYTCHESGCTESFRKKSQLRHHLSEHKNLQAFQCDFEGCGKVFTQGSHLQRHKKMHQGYVCQVEGCNLKFDKWSLLRKHKAVDHKTKYPCTTCNMTLPNKAMLRAHQKTHSGERQMYKCPHADCGRAYFTLSNLRTHIRSYHDGVRHTCLEPGCDRKFSTKQKLQQHQAIHDQNKTLPKKKYPKKGHRRKSESSRLTGIDPKQITDHPTIANSFCVEEKDEELGSASDSEDEDIPVNMPIHGSRVLWREEELEQSTEICDRWIDKSVCDKLETERPEFSEHDESDTNIIGAKDMLISSKKMLNEEGIISNVQLNVENSPEAEISNNEQVLLLKPEQIREIHWLSEDSEDTLMLNKDEKSNQCHNCENSDNELLVECSPHRQWS